MSSISIKDYFALAGSRFTNADAKVIGPVLQELAEAGDVTPAQVVEAARSTNSPLHSYFEWDDKVAADKFRNLEAGDMIRNIRIKVVSSGQERVSRAYNVQRPAAPTPPAPPRQYVVPVTGGPEQLVAAALRDLDAWLLKYQSQFALYGKFADAVAPIANQISEFKEDFQGGHLSGPLRKAVEQFLEWEVSYGAHSAARLYGEHLNFVLAAINDLRAAAGPTQLERLGAE